MADFDSLDGIAQELSLDADERLILTLCQQVMLGRDVVAERAVRTVQTKARVRDRFAAAAVTGHWARTDDLPPWAREAAADIAARVPAQQRVVVEAAVPEFGGRITRRSRALLVLIELYAFEPWSDGVGWVTHSRRKALADIAAYLPALRPDDLDAVTAEFTAVLRALGRKRIRWGRVAAASAVGLTAGVATMGLATPLIAAAVGGALGLSGAAATSAGLAALGGGSIAAGGFGMAGGTALLTGLGAITGAGAAAAGTRITGWSAGQVVVDAVKLDVVTRLVVLDADGDEEKARRVVEGLQARLDEVGVRIGRLAEQLRRLSTDNARLTTENEQLRERLQDEHDEARLAETALQIVIDRLPASA